MYNLLTYIKLIRYKHTHTRVYLQFAFNLLNKIGSKFKMDNAVINCVNLQT